eukprot:gene5802-7290_t
MPTGGNSDEQHQHQQQGFCKFYLGLPKKPATTIRFFDRNDYFTLHGEDALFAAKGVFKTMGIIKYWGTEKLPSVNMSQMVFDNTLKELLLIKNYRVEVYANKSKTGKWELTKKASPGNTQMFEDILYAGNMNASSIVMAVNVGSRASDKIVGVAFCDTAKNEFRVCEFPDNDQFSNLEALVVQVGARECLMLSDKANPSLLKPTTLFDSLFTSFFAQDVAGRGTLWCHGDTALKFFDMHLAFRDIEQDLSRLLKLEADQSVSTFEELDKHVAMGCTTAIIKYLELLANDDNFSRFSINTHNFSQYMRLDAAAVRALGIFPSSADGLIPGDGATTKSQSLFGLLNRCKTAQGQRLLQQWLKQPLLDVKRIAERHDIVETFANNDALRSDMNRLSKKFQRKKGQLQDCVQAYNAITKIPDLHSIIASHKGEHAPLLSGYFLDDLSDLATDFAKYRELIEKTIDLAEVDRHEYLIKPSFNRDLQQARDRMDELQKQLPQILRQVSDDLGFDAQKTVKLERDSKTNQFLLRVSRAHEKKLRGARRYEIMETLKNGVKFVNKPLKSLNEEYVSCYENYLKIQEEVAQKVIGGYFEPMEDLNSSVALLDVLLSFAVACMEAPIPFVKPRMTALGEGDIVLSACRHPCVEMQDSISFIPNDIGIAVLFAQIGCFVPAQSARICLTDICVCDSILARVGAGDSQLKGISTFMSEMLETASILRSASSQSLVIIDELGRGTSTYDGFGLAWAICEYIARNIRCFCLFATHFHELTGMGDELKNVTNLHVDAATINGTLTLLYKIKPGICDRSFGIHVAELADFPEEVVQVAKAKAKELEEFVVDASTEDHPSKQAKLADEEEISLLDFINKASTIDLHQNPADVLQRLRELREV